MAGPWEQYQAPSGSPTFAGTVRPKAPQPAEAGPWDRFSASAAPTAPPAPVQPAPIPGVPNVPSYEEPPDTRGWPRRIFDTSPFGSMLDPASKTGQRAREGFQEGYGDRPVSWRNPLDLLAGTMGGLYVGAASAAGGVVEDLGGSPGLAHDTRNLLGNAGQFVNPEISVAGGAYVAARKALPGVRTAEKVAQKIFAPETVDDAAREAAASIRGASGTAARDTATTATQIEPFHKAVNAMPDPDRLAFIDYVEGRSNKYAGQTLQDPAMMAFANTLRTEFDKRVGKLQALPSTQQAAFIDDYFPHFWKDPKAAQTVANEFGGMSRQGSGASLRKRSMPTIADGLAAGLQPLSTNPLEMTMRYVTSMDRFIAAAEVLDTANAAGTVQWVKPRVMGASGNPNSYKTPPGFVKLEGRGTTRGDGAQAFAPEGFARIYNNWISRGFADMGQEYGQTYDVLRRGSNSITALELGLSGYHVLTMAQEGVVNGVASALSELRKGNVRSAAAKLAKAPGAPLAPLVPRSVFPTRGKKVQDVYLGLSPGTAADREIADLLTQAGGRAKGAGHAPDYNFSQTGSYVTALKRGALKGQLLADKTELSSGVGGAAKVAFRHVGRIIDTVAQPIFEKYIPLVKNGAFYENMSTWMKQNPTASQAEKIGAARQIWDSIDNRFGEMVSDNVFWNQTLKQTAQLGLRSWSWTMGTARELGGAARDITRAPMKTPVGIGPNDTRWTQKMDYAIALPLVYGGMSAVYQYLKTGEAPRDLHDLAAPRTGGTDAKTGEPERLLPPGYMKDVYGFSHDPRGEIKNKLATAPAKLVELWQNKDWRGDPIFPPNASPPEWLSAFWNYASSSFGPISIKNAMRTPEGSNLNAFERALGVRQAPRYLTDPDGFTSMMDRIDAKKWQGKKRHDARERKIYGEE